MDRINNHHISIQSEIHTESISNSDQTLTAENSDVFNSLSNTSDFVDQASYKCKKHFWSGYQPPNILPTQILSNALDDNISSDTEYDETQEFDYIKMFAAPTPAPDNLMALLPITKTFAWIIL